MTEPKAVLALYRDAHERAPGRVRAAIEALLASAALGRAERSDWLARLRGLSLVQLEPRPGQMHFPLVLPAPLFGTIARVEVATAPGLGLGLRDPVEKRVKPWLGATLSALCGINEAAVAERLRPIGLNLRIGHAWAPPEPELELKGESMDLAICVAILSHLTGRRPRGAWILSGALGAPKELAPVAHAKDKREVIAVEAPDLPPERLHIVAETQTVTLLLQAIFGDDILAAVAQSFETSATALLDQARSKWLARSEAEAAALAAQALNLNPSEHERAIAHLMLGAQAVHEGRLDAADTYLKDLDSLAANSAEGWARHEIEAARIRMAGASLDRLRPGEGLRLLDGSLRWLKGREPDDRDQTWHRLFAEASGSQSALLAAAGDLDGAITAREAALSQGPPQESARSLTALAELVARRGDPAAAQRHLKAAQHALSRIPPGEGRDKTTKFWRIAAIRHGVEPISARDLARAAANPPNLGKWPTSAEYVAILLASDDEPTALAWFEAYIFGQAPAPHPAWVFFLVTSCARAVAREMTSPRWREGAAALVAHLEALAPDPAILNACRDFTDGASPGPLLRRAVY